MQTLIFCDCLSIEVVMESKIIHFVSPLKSIKQKGIFENNVYLK